MWHLGTSFSGRLGSVRFTVGFNDLKSLFQCKWFHDSMILRDADDTTLRTPGDALVCRTAIQMDPDRLEQWMGQQDPYEIQQGQSPAPVKKQAPATIQPGDCWAGAALWKRPWGCWWAVSWTWANSTWAAERTTSLLGCISRGMASQSREGIIPLYATFR